METLDPAHQRLLQSAETSGVMTMEETLVTTALVPAQTLVSSECEVTNGFVKNGTSLPYIIETNNTVGNRKRSSKILPVCGICGKKFVCVTTMKRHLVTHTGERPFNCKVCGKQYTQKGNLRVHERTHRNDRPFECNICHQKFYRKEPMQKHQWRQHGIGHYKTRPPGPDGSSTVGIIGAESVLYNSVVDRMTTDQSEDTPLTIDQSEDAVHDSSPNIVYETNLEVPEPVSHAEISATVIESFSDEEDETGDQHSIAKVVTRYINETQDTTDHDHDDPRRSLEILKQNQDNNDSNDNSTTTPQHTTDTNDNTDRPMKLKMKLAQAYLREVEEEREREERDVRSREGRDRERTGSLGDIEENLGEIQLTPPQQSVTNLTMAKPVLENNNNSNSNSKESVECVCKACGSKCSVSDPYNFSCGRCNVKYTSLPTHLIADPLQCIGCLQVFQHKPAMKEHQSSHDKERPFVCCKCGYEFKQKAHLQKHQWRIHRRKLEQDPNIKEAEAILKAVNDLPSETPPTPVTPVTPVTPTLQQEIIRGDPPMRITSLEQLEGSAPLDLSPCKMYGSVNSINQWVQQVETARTPIVPDITILKKPLMTAEDIKVKLPTEPLKLSQLQAQDKVSVTIQLLEPPKLGTWQHTGNINQPFAVKSKPSDSAPLTSWRSLQSARDDNPLLNQKTPDLTSRPPPVIFIDTAEDRVFKRAKTEQSQPADLSISQTLDFSPPSALSPPLNLTKTRDEDAPFDYTISRGSSDLITGQLRRMRHQDQRGGI